MSFSGGTTVSPLLLVTNLSIAIHTEHCFGPDCPFGFEGAMEVHGDWHEGGKGKMRVQGVCL